MREEFCYQASFIQHANMFKILQKIYANITWFFRRLHNVWKFMKLAWGDYWFDHGHLDNLMIFKLEQMAKGFRSKRAWRKSAVRVAEEIEFVIDKLKEIGNLETDFHEYIEEKYKPPKHEESGLDYFEFIKSKKYQDYLKTPQGKKYDELFRKSMFFNDKKEILERERLYKFIAEHITNWWD